MTKLNIGDKVRRKPEYLHSGMWNGQEDTLLVTNVVDQFITLEHFGDRLFEIERFELVMDKINLVDKYETSDGLPVRILALDLAGDSFSVAACIRELSGRDYIKSVNMFGIDRFGNRVVHKCNPYKDFKIDDKVLVSYDNKNWVRRYFAGVIDGKPYSFQGGTSSFTDGSRGNKLPWKFCKKYNEEN